MPHALLGLDGFLDPFCSPTGGPLGVAGREVQGELVEAGVKLNYFPSPGYLALCPFVWVLFIRVCPVGPVGSLGPGEVILV